MGKGTPNAMLGCCCREKADALEGLLQVLNRLDVLRVKGKCEAVPIGKRSR
jgi:hypothetical protein